jgi:hypothetical protein
MRNPSNETSSSPDRAAEVQLAAYNAAFHELGLNWYWDLPTWRVLQLPAGDKAGPVGRYLATMQPHLLRAYDADFLVGAIETAKARCWDAACQCHQPADWAEIQRGDTGF